MKRKWKRKHKSEKTQMKQPVIPTAPPHRQSDGSIHIVSSTYRIDIQLLWDLKEYLRNAQKSENTTKRIQLANITNFMPDAPPGGGQHQTEYSQRLIRRLYLFDLHGNKSVTVFMLLNQSSTAIIWLGYRKNLPGRDTPWPEKGRTKAAKLVGTKVKLARNKRKNLVKPAPLARGLISQSVEQNTTQLFETVLQVKRGTKCI